MFDELATKRGTRDALKVQPEIHRGDELPEAVRVLEGGRLGEVLELDLGEASGGEALTGDSDTGVFPWAAPAVEVLGVGRLPHHRLGPVAQPIEVALATHLRQKPACRSQSPREISEQPGLIEDPMEGCGAEDDVRRPLEIDVEQVGEQVLDVSLEIGIEIAPSRLDHLRRGIHRDDAADRQALEEESRQPAAAASGVDRGFVAPQRKPVE